MLTLPAAEQAHAGQATATSDRAHSRYTVVKGDTLSEIAQQHLDDAEAWPWIFEASRGIPQPDGRRLTDPDLILPRWHLLIPSAAETPPELPTSPEPERAAPSSQSSLSSPDASAPPATPTPTPVAETSPATEGAIPAPIAPVSAPAVPSPSVSATVASDVSNDEKPESGASDRDPEAPAPWLLVGLTGAGGVLAAGLLAALRQRRRAQFRARRPGRMIQAPPPELVPVEKTLMTEGQAETPTLVAIDQALSLLAVSGEDRVVPPQLLAVQLLPGEVAVQLVEPVTLAHPWRPDPADGRRWLLAAGAYQQEATARSAYPQLVSVGLDDDGATWLVNLEQLGTISLTGDPTYAADFARYLAAEIAVNPWVRQVQLDCIGIAPEAEPLDPARIRHHRLEDPAPLDAAIAAAGATIDKCATHDVTSTAAPTPWCDECSSTYSPGSATWRGTPTTPTPCSKWPNGRRRCSGARSQATRTRSAWPAGCRLPGRVRRLAVAHVGRRGICVRRARLGRLTTPDSKRYPAIIDLIVKARALYDTAGNRPRRTPRSPACARSTGAAPP